MAYLEVCVYFQQFMISVGSSNKEYQQISKCNPYLHTSYRWNGT